MLDRLISGAGAVTDGADRSVRWFGRGSRRGLATTRPGSVVIAVLLLILAALFVVAGLEATDPSTPVTLDVVALSRQGRHGDRAYATLSGSVSDAYLEFYSDVNDNGRKDADEETTEWYYWLVDPTARAGVTVRTTRPPDQILKFHASGMLVTKPVYLNDDDWTSDAKTNRAGLSIEPRVVLDATRLRAGSGASAKLDLAGPLPATGTRVDLSGARIGGYGWVCTSDIDGNGVCDLDEENQYEVLVFDPVSKHAIGVLVDDVPEFADPVAFTGRLHLDERAIDEVQRVNGDEFDALDLEISPVFVLDEGTAPRSAPLAFAMAAILLVVAGVIFIGLAGGYLIYRRGGGRLPEPATTLGPGERLPLRITGVVRTPTGLEHVREVPGELVRFVLGRPVAPAEPPPADLAPPADSVFDVSSAETTFDAPAADPQPAEPSLTAEPPPETSPTDDLAPIDTTLLIERTGYPQGVALGLGELTRLSSGQVMAFRGIRPGLRAVAGTGPLILSFDSEAERDRVAAELLDETGLGPDGTQIGTP